MKVTLALAVFCAALALAVSENCRSDSDCNHVTCPESDYTVDCARGECTCTHTTATCSAASDCHGAADNCRFGWHCVDAKCRCGFGFPTGGK